MDLPSGADGGKLEIVKEKTVEVTGSVPGVAVTPSSPINGQA